MLTPREKLVLDCIRSDPAASQDAIAAMLGLSRSAVAVHITNLSAKGAIRGRAYILDDAPYVVAVGGAAVDISGRSSAKIRRGDSNPGSISMVAGGVARNVAQNLVSLGIDTRLLSVVGDDDHGHFVAQGAREAGIDTKGLVIHPGARTATYLSVMNEAGELDAGISDMQILDNVDASLLQKHDNMLRNASAIFVDANLSTDALQSLFDNHGSRTIVADTVSEAKAPRLAPFLSQIDILKPTLAEAGALLGQAVRSRRQVTSIARALRERGVDRVFVSLGPHGVFAADGTTSERVPTRSEAAESVTGAGDAFVAALIAGSLDRLPLRKMAEFGNAVASARLRSDPSLGAEAELRAIAAEFLSREDCHA